MTNPRLARQRILAALHKAKNPHVWVWSLDSRRPKGVRVLHKIAELRVADLNSLLEAAGEGTKARRP